MVTSPAVFTQLFPLQCPSSPRITIKTDRATDFCLIWSTKQPNQVIRYKTVRGVSRPCGIACIFPSAECTCQREPAGSLTHTFDLPLGLGGKTIYYFFHPQCNKTPGIITGPCLEQVVKVPLVGAFYASAHLFNTVIFPINQWFPISWNVRDCDPDNMAPVSPNMIIRSAGTYLFRVNATLRADNGASTFSGRFRNTTTGQITGSGPLGSLASGTEASFGWDAFITAALNNRLRAEVFATGPGISRYKPPTDVECGKIS